MTEKLNYRKLNGELEHILEQLQNGEVDIDKAIKLYERGQKIVQQLKNYLKTAENKITKVTTSKK